MRYSLCFYVYEHWRPDTGACFYVGKGKDKRAWNMKNRNLPHRAVQSELIALGLAVDVRIVIRDVAEDTAFKVERDTIAKHGRASLANRSNGGEGPSGIVVSAETRLKLSLAGKGRRGPIGFKHSAETRAKMSLRQKGRKRTPEQIAQMSAIRIGKKQSPEHAAKSAKAVLGRKQSQEEIEKRRRAITGKKRTPEQVAAMKARMRQVAVVCLDDGRQFASTKDAARYYAVGQGNISLMCQGKRKCVGGFHFKYADAA